MSNEMWCMTPECAMLNPGIPIPIFHLANTNDVITNPNAAFSTGQVGFGKRTYETAFKNRVVISFCDKTTLILFVKNWSSRCCAI